MIANYDQIFTPEMKKLILKVTSECISRVGAKGYTIEQGQLWFDKFEDGTVKIFSINKVFYPEESDTQE